MITPETVSLKECPAPCLHPPVLMRVERDGLPRWAISCPQCGRGMIGNRIEGFDLDGMNMVNVLKTGDDLERMVERWNR